MLKESDCFIDDENQSNSRVVNNGYICGKPEFQVQIDKLKKIESFLEDFGFLTLGRDFIFSTEWTFSIQNISTSLELTMGNIACCCENGSIADANTLLRKYRDDLFFYIYLAVYNETFRFGDERTAAKKMKNRISEWIKNKQKNLYLKDVLDAIEFEPKIKETIDKYNLRAVFKNIGDRLNNFVHSNGYVFYNRNIVEYESVEFLNELKSLADDAVYFTTVFVFLLALCSPNYIMSTYYTDCLDCGESPPENSQYWVAKFIWDFIKENSKLIDEQAYAYLKDNCCMNL